MTHPPSPADSFGLIAHAAGLLATMLRYLKVRLTPAGLEAKTEGAHYGFAAAMVAGALFIPVLGCVFLIIALAFAIAAAFGGGSAWIAVIGAAALLHLGGAVSLVWLGRRRCETNTFDDTLAELKKDPPWLTQLTALN